MLTLHTAEPTTARPVTRPAHNPAHNPAQQRNDVPSPAPSIPTSDDDDDTPVAERRLPLPGVPERAYRDSSLCRLRQRNNAA
jgi:hypothetical protein